MGIANIFDDRQDLEDLAEYCSLGMDAVLFPINQNQLGVTLGAL